MKQEIKFMFDYGCPPLWLCGDNNGPWLVSSDGYFVDDFSSVDGKQLDIRLPEERLKCEYELERCVKLIYDIYCCIWDINEFPAGEPYIGFEDEREKNDFFDACDYVIKRMREIFGNEFTVHKYTETVVKERALGCRQKLKKE